MTFFCNIVCLNVLFYHVSLPCQGMCSSWAVVWLNGLIRPRIPCCSAVSISTSAPRGPLWASDLARPLRALPGLPNHQASWLHCGPTMGGCLSKPKPGDTHTHSFSFSLSSVPLPPHDPFTLKSCNNWHLFLRLYIGQSNLPRSAAPLPPCGVAFFWCCRNFNALNCPLFFIGIKQKYDWQVFECCTMYRCSVLFFSILSCWRSEMWLHLSIGLFPFNSKSVGAGVKKKKKSCEIKHGEPFITQTKINNSYNSVKSYSEYKMYLVFPTWGQCSRFGDAFDVRLFLSLPLHRSYEAHVANM